MLKQAQKGPSQAGRRVAAGSRRQPPAAAQQPASLAPISLEGLKPTQLHTRLGTACDKLNPATVVNYTFYF